VKTRALRIVDEVVNRLKSIDGMGDYYNNVGDRVFKGRYRFTEQDNFPIISVKPAGDAVQQANNGDYRKYKLSKVIEIHGIVSVVDVNNPMDEAELLVADIKRAIFSQDERLGGNAYATEYSGTFIGDLDESVNMVSVQVNLAIVYAEDLSNPNF
jgi:hypothetical protein